jgi:hypothetical protein
MTNPLLDYLTGSGGVQQPENVLVFPNNAGTGTPRIVVGADIPNEIANYSALYTIPAALIFYDVVGGVEVGYHFEAEARNVFNTEPAIVIGKVTYPIPGNPASATAADVTIQQSWEKTTVQMLQKFVVDQNQRMYYSNSATPMPIMDTGSVVVAIPSGSTNFAFGPVNWRNNVTLPSAPFLTTQIVSGSGQAPTASILVTSVGQSSWSGRFIHPTGTTAAFNCTIHWNCACV